MKNLEMKELRGHLGMLAFSMDSQWCVMHREDLPEPTRVCAEGQYQGMIFTLTLWAVTGSGTTRASIGCSSRANPAVTPTSTPTRRTEL